MTATPSRWFPVGMNILLLGHRDIASLTAVNRVVAGLSGHSHTVLLSEKDGDENVLLDRLAETDHDLCDRFLNGELGVPPQEAITQRPAGAFEAPNSDEGLDKLRQLKPDLIISIRYRKILHDEAISIPPQGVINLHSGILPNYRGVMATFWAMLDDQAEIGTTLHRITDSGIDTGPVIAIDRRPADYSRSYLSNVLSLYPAGCRSVVSAVQKLAAGEALDEQSQPSGGRYFRAPNEEAVRGFDARGLNLVDGAEDQDLLKPRF